MKPYYKIKNGKALDEPIPHTIDSFSREDLADLSFTPVELGLQKLAWWPAIEVTPTVSIEQKLTDTEILTLNSEKKQVEVSYVVHPWTSEEFKELQDQLCEKINKAVVDAISGSTRFSLEYVRREAQARSYIEQIDALSLNDELPPAPRLIANFAASAGVDAVYAARLTIAQADELYTIQDDLADLRMCKYEIKRATTVFNAVQLADEIIGKINAVAKSIT